MITTTVADQIIQVIEHLGQKFGIAIDWSEENLLPVAEHLAGRIVDWRIASSIFWVALCGIFIIAGIIWAVICCKKAEGYGGWECMCAASICLGFFGLIGFCVNIYSLIQCITFPELAIFEYIQSFMNQ